MPDLDPTWPPVDRLGRPEPHGFTWITWLRALPGLIEFFNRRVPDEFYTLDTEEDGTAVAVIACPCGKEPRIPVTVCRECECERFYLAVGDRVLVGNSPQDREEVES